jgi:hypothetical protein
MTPRPPSKLQNPETPSEPKESLTPAESGGESSDPGKETREHFKRFVAEFSSESDRACVILGAARLDVLLKRLLSGHLLPSVSSSDELLDGDAPLGTFSSRIHACYRLGLIDAELARALNLIRRIRNEFAHEASTVSLSHSSHRDRIKQLISPIKNTSIFRTFLRLPELGDASGSARDFRAGLAFVCARLEGAADRVQTTDTSQRTGLFLTKWVVDAKTEKQTS